MIDWMDEAQAPCFPETSQALDEPNGLLAAGGRLSPLWLDQAYRRGIFPWNDPDDVRLWWSPAPRAVITRSAFRIPRTVRKLLSRQQPLITMNLAFAEVIEYCSRPREYDGAGAGSWIDTQMMAAYLRLHQAGRAISVELWSDTGQLSGGLYGVLIGRVFFGESMFSHQSNASKRVFAQAAPVLFNCGIEIIDCQMQTDHLSQFGAGEVDRETFEQCLQVSQQQALAIPLPTCISHTRLNRAPLITGR